MKQIKSLPAILLSLLLSAGLSSCEKVDDLGYSNKHILELKANGEEHIYHRNFAANNQSPYDFYSNSSAFIVRFRGCLITNVNPKWQHLSVNSLLHRGSIAVAM